MRQRAHRVALVAGLLAVAFVTQVTVATAASAAPERACRAVTAKVTAGSAVTLKLSCRVASRNAPGPRVIGPKRRISTRIVTKPRLGSLGRINRAKARVVYRAKPKAKGVDRLRFRIRSKDGRRYRGKVIVTVRAKPTTPTPPVDPPVDPPVAPPVDPPDDGLPPKLPAVPASVASTTRAWTPTTYDTCSKELHDRFSVIGPDGVRYPTWHPPTIVDPTTGERCGFGHEHGSDPAGSDIYDWTVAHFAASEYPGFAGLPFGIAAESLNEWAAQDTGIATRSEDHVGYKVDVANDVSLIGPDGAANGVKCDFLTIVHQGSHSPDALSNNAHELIYANRCDDGTELISTTLSRFGDPGSFNRSCNPAVEISTVDNGYPSGGGSRLIPDRTCVERDVLVPSGKTTSVWSLYEKWTSENSIETADGTEIASFPAAFGVFNPSRYANGGATMARTLPLCWETAANGDRARGGDCSLATGNGLVTTEFPWDEPKSPFDGTRRDFYLWGTKVRNASGQSKVWTDPYGGNAQAAPFPGAICQLVSPLDNENEGDTKTLVFGRNKTFDAEGVHAPN